MLTQLFSSDRHDRNTFNYLNSLFRKKIKEGIHYDKEQLQRHKRIKIIFIHSINKESLPK
jgi:hypothetical protein